MEAAALLGDTLPKLGVLAAAAAAAAVLVARDERHRAIAMVAALALALALLVGQIEGTEQFHSVSKSASRLVAVLALAAAVVAATAYLFVRKPQALPLLAVAVLPFRVPIAVAGSTANLLVPLYLVIAGGCATYVWNRFRASERAPRSRPRSAIEIALAVFVVLYAVQALYSRDFDSALTQVVFFLVPFVVLFRLLTQVTWSGQLVVRCLAILAAAALLFSAIGFWEYYQRELFWNPKVIASNQFDSFFRVNSVFWDPNIYGRFLVLAMLWLTALMLWSGRLKVALWTAAALAVLWGGLILTFSQSSFVALLAGLAVLAALRWDVRKTVLATAGGLVLGIVGVFAFQGSLGIELGSARGVDEFTSGRGGLISGGVSLFGDRPLWGYGSGSFGRVFRQEQDGNQAQSVSASHTLPVTVAAEQGVVGLAAYIAVLLVALVTLLGNRRYREAVRARGPPELSARPFEADVSDPAVFQPARAAIAAAFVALLAHTMVYAAFLEDPFSWVLMATGLALAPSAALAGWSKSEPASTQARAHNKPVVSLAE